MAAETHRDPTKVWTSLLGESDDHSRDVKGGHIMLGGIAFQMGQ
jgi:hypothetical protein